MNIEPKKIIFENTFFAATLAYIENQSSCWEILRKVSSLPGAKGELLEILAQCVRNNEITNFSISLEDFSLCSDITSLGAFKSGYLLKDPAGHIVFRGWGESWKASLVKIGEFSLDANYKRHIFSIVELRQSLANSDDIFIEAFFKRDRVFWGIAGPKDTISDEAEVITSEKNVVTDSWLQISRSRSSTNSFSQATISKDELSEMLSQSIYEHDSRLHFGSPGGLKFINNYAVIRNVDDIDDGIYIINPVSKELVFQKKFQNFDILSQFLFLHDSLASPAVYLFFSVSFDRISAKYGQRAIRLALLTLGSVLQQVHLAATANGLRYRTIAGFDELQCGKILNIKGREILVCAAILGK